MSDDPRLDPHVDDARLSELIPTPSPASSPARA